MFDAHCDTLIKITNENELEKNNFDVDFERLSIYGNAVQIFAVFNNGSLKVRDIIYYINLLKKECDRSNLAEFCVNCNDIVNSIYPVCALTSVEGLGNTPDFKSVDIDTFYKMGVRIVGITWNNDNFLCGGCENNNIGLTDFGKEIVDKIRNKNMILDISHISDVGFWQIAKIDNLSVIATHSNSKTICKSNRNLTDEQFRIICDKGGIVGINTYPPFVTGYEKAEVKDLICHIEYFCSLGGEKNICLGADFDGIDFKTIGLSDCSKMNFLFEELARLNYSDRQIYDISYGNFFDFYRKMNF